MQILDVHASFEMKYKQYYLYLHKYFNWLGGGRGGGSKKISGNWTEFESMKLKETVENVVCFFY